MSLPINQVLTGNCIEVMKTFPNESIDMAMFSPPYWGLRDYRVAGQIGLEDHPCKYIATMVEVCHGVNRLLKENGSMYIVISDTYFGGKGKSGSSKPEETEVRINTLQRGYHELSIDRPQNIAKQDGKWLQPKQLLGIPWRIAIALQEDGWILRNDIIWNKPNHMPSSVKDRLTKTYEHIFFFVKNRKYYYNLDAIRKPHKSVKAMQTYYEESKIKKAKRFRRRESLFQIVPVEAPHRGSKDIIGRYSGKFVGLGKESEKFGSPRARTQRKYEGQSINPSEGHIRRGAEFAEAFKDGTAFHPLGKNPGDIFQSQKEPYLKNNPHTMRLKTEKYVALDPSRPMDLSYPKGKNPGDVIKWANIPGQAQQGNFGHGGTHANLFNHPDGKNPGDFWSVNTKPFKGAHFAVYPEAICMDPIKASCPLNGIVLDPMCGSGTTLVVAKKLGRRWVGIDLNPAYIEMAKERLNKIPEKLTSFS